MLLYEDFSSGTRENKLDIVAGFGTRLEHFVNVLFLGELDGAILRYRAQFFTVALVADEINLDLFGSVLLDFFQPLDTAEERLLLGDIVSEEYTMSVSIKNARDRAERFLT